MKSNIDIISERLGGFWRCVLWLWLMLGFLSPCLAFSQSQGKVKRGEDKESEYNSTPRGGHTRTTGRAPAIIPKKGQTAPPPPIPGAVTKPTQAPSPPVPQEPEAPVKSSVSLATQQGIPEDIVSFKTNFEKDVKCIPLPLNAKITVDFEEAPLQDIVKFIACITRRNFIIATNLKSGKTITIMSTTPVTVYEAYKAFLSALDIHGLTVVPRGAFYEIVETSKAKQLPVPLYGPEDSVPAEDRLVTRIVTLKHIEVKEIEPVLQKFKTAVGDVTSYAPGNSLILTDLASNISRMLDFIRELDVPTGREKIWVRPVQYASAAQMGQLITELFAGKDGGAGQAAKPQAKPAPPAGAPAGQLGSMEGPATVSKVIVDERTNSLIIVATPTAYLKIDRLLRKVDVPIEGEGQIHIYYLENADAEEIASTLQALASGARAAPAGGGGAGTKKGAGAATKKGAAGTAALFEGEVKITAHKPTNALVIEATLKDFLALKRVIQQLDVRRKQVYVEAVIMEISSNKDRKLGISGSGGMTFNIGGNEVPFLFGMGGLGMSGLDLQQLTTGGIAIGLQGPLVDVSTGTTGQATTSGALAIPSYGFLIQALESSSDVNVLSTPHILTMDNEEAEIVVGKQIPYQATSLGGLATLSSLYGYQGLTGTTTGTTTTASTLATLAPYLGGYGYGAYVQRIDVDLTLKIKPQISESNFVRLQIQQSVDDVESLDPHLGPTTSKRKVTNTVVVRDQQPVVIGGLIRDIEVTGVNKVPFLGDIPVIGMLFRKTAKRIEKRNLLMVITPYIIEDPSDLARIHEQKMDEMRQFAEYLATKKREYESGIDYRKKTGILEDIHKVLERARKDREMLEKSKAEDRDIVGPPETHDLDFNPFGERNPIDAQGLQPEEGTNEE
mgnify:CR=1 FL=1